MKTLITSAIVFITLISCSHKNTVAGPIKYKFFHGDTGKQIHGYYSLGKYMQEKKAWRMDTETGVCVPYFTQDYGNQ